MPLDELLHNSGFRTGLVAAAVALPVVVAIVFVSIRAGRRSADPLPVAGIALVIAALIGLANARGGVPPNDQLVVGLVLLTLGPLVATFARSRLFTILSTLPGAALVAWAASLDNNVEWIAPIVFLVTVACAALVADFDRANARAGLGPVLMAVTALAAYTALPDTEQIAALAGAALPIALLGAPLPVASLGGPGAASTVGLFVWIAAVGGRARPGSFVGAIACLGVMVLEPVVRRIVPRGRSVRPRAPLSVRAMLVVALDIALVAGTSRIAGLETSALAAAALSALLLAPAAIVLAFVLVPWGRDQSAPWPTSGASRSRRVRGRPVTDPMHR